MHIISLLGLSVGLSPFQCCLGYLPPLFPSQKSDAIVLSVDAFIQTCLRTWRIRQRGGQATGSRHRRTIKVHHDSPTCVVIRSGYLPRTFLLRFPPCKLEPKFIRSFFITKVLRPMLVQLKLIPV